MTTEIDAPDSIQRWLEEGRTDVGRFAANGLGIYLHDKQLEVIEAVYDGEAQYYLLDWANRAGKTLTLCVMHMHQILYKPRLKYFSRKEFKEAEYATLHTAPLNELAGRAHLALSEITKGMSPAQRDIETGKRRPAPLGQLFFAIKERDQTGADHMVLRCASGGKTDFRSTEGKGARIEGGSWWLITWDEWPSTEGDPETIRFVLNVRLTNRAADFDAPIILTGTRTEDTEHIAKEFEERAEDPDEPDWWGNHASRMDNPAANLKAIERARRNFDPEDFNRAVLGIEGGAKGRIFPSILVDPMFTKDLPRFTSPHPGDGFPMKSEIVSPWTYLHLWDLALAAADNIGMVLRVPSDWQFSVEKPITGVSLKRVPGSHTLTSAEILHTIEETFLPYGGLIVLDTTDAHGRNIQRELQMAGYPVEAFTFNARTGIRPTASSMIRKDRAIHRARLLMGEGLDFERDKAGNAKLDADAVAKLDTSKRYGAIRLPAEWTIVRDQIALLKPDDQRQRKDAAMTLLMGADVAFRNRVANSPQNRGEQRLAVFAH